MTLHDHPAVGQGRQTRHAANQPNACPPCDGSCNQGRACPNRERRPVHGHGLVWAVVYALLLVLLLLVVHAGAAR